jgi:hypothetical protein
VLYDEPPPHLITLYRTSSTEDTAGGRQLVRELVQSNIPCSINQGGASTMSQFDQTQMVIGGRVAMLTEDLTTIPQRGWVGVAVNVDTEETQTCIFTGGVSAGRQYNGIPSFTYLSVEIYL